MSSRLAIALGIGVVALVSTLGDYVWFEIGIGHRPAAGILHGALLLTTVGGVLGATAGRLARGLPLGAVAGVMGALAYYALAPVTGSTGAMVAAWCALWVVLALVDGRLLDRSRRPMAVDLGRGALAALACGLAFFLLVGTLWGHPVDPRNYLVQFLAWTAAWAPGLATIVLTRPRTSGPDAPR
ncbi:MAG: hypothetical protein KJ066_07100 [Acidobacteria bacterium]|nr:hypothetical protein [Acidobacteriota bacterium]